ncbi:MAG: addiction module protein [Chitinivibrionales bacterium]|nr:addiction module protein [Chitinivibrionales bacterium]
MLTTQELLHEAETLPVEDRASLADSLLKTLNAPDPQIDKQWITVAQRRLNEIKTGKVKAIPGKEVFKKIQKRFEK